MRHVKRISTNLLIYVILLCVVFLILYPLASNVSAMFKSFNDLVDKSVVFIPREPSLERIRSTIDIMDYWVALLSSMMLCAGQALLQMVACALAGYGFARFQFPFKKFWFALAILTMLIPTALLMPSLFMKFRFFDLLGISRLLTGNTLNLIGTPVPLLIMSIFCMGTKNGLYIYLVRQFFMNMPKELEESGRIDGAGVMCIFTRIMLPNAIPILITVFMFSFSWQWTDVYWTELFMPEFVGVSNAISHLSTYGQGNIDPIVRTATMNTGVILAIIPILVLFLFLQRFFVQGVERSGLVG